MVSLCSPLIDIRVGSCNCLNVIVCHACALRWGSNPYRKLFLLGFAHPVEGSPFQVQGVCMRTALIRGRDRRKTGCGFGYSILYNMY